MLRHVAGIAEIVEDIESAVRFYRETLGLPVQMEGDGYAVVKIAGIPDFGIWQRARAAQIVFGDSGAAERIPLGFTVGFEVDSVEKAEQKLRGEKVKVVQSLQTEPWGQVTSRFHSPSGALCEVSETPPARRIASHLKLESDS